MNPSLRTHRRVEYTTVVTVDSCRTAAATWTVVYSHDLATQAQISLLKMASYDSLPVAANPEEVLLQKPKKTSLRYLIGSAALAAFVLGAISV